ncbi:hypothetical protein J2S07_001297 [Robertmurraya andreesenii]|uniref:Sporulation inhibitor of replication protein SirA n=1 Tax=Anoxybacillus andreesenii TaxID=1325932 RepID=A0ABT9V211_9BACL|nr:hypothetical protein [Robertmurraya andreesenii]
MRTYQIYIIDNEFASHYFGREGMFFQLFQEYDESEGELQTILLKQIYYITNSIPSIRLHQYLQQQLQMTKGFYVSGGLYGIDHGRTSSATLEVSERHLTLKAQGSYEAETRFFEILRKNKENYLAIDLRNQRYGWLKPIKERKFV